MADRTTPADGPCVDGIDHVELVVPGRYEAAAWYADVLGLSVIGELEAWADPPSYPLMGSSDGGRTMLALFHGTPDPTGGVHDRRIAFGRTGRPSSRSWLVSTPSPVSSRRGSTMS